MEWTDETTYLRISSAEIHAAQASAWLASAKCGATVTFLGTVRDATSTKGVKGIFYDAFVPLALEELKKIVAAGTVRGSPTTLIRVEHRLGYLHPGTVSTLIGVSSPQRAEAFRVAQEILEQIKRKVPIWKQEEYTDGTKLWLRGQPLGNRSGGG